jgi:hypothetical protein
MLQEFVPNILSIFQTYVASVYLDVTYISHICCKCFIWILHMFCNCFSNVFRCFFKYFRRMLQVFQLFQTYVTCVSPRCCKSISVMLLGSHLPQLSAAAIGAPSSRRRRPAGEAEEVQAVPAWGQAAQARAAWPPSGHTKRSIGADVPMSGC